jgi:tetratricopeptide (TPR) repeat protein
MAPPAERIKLNRKALREPDEFQTLTSQVAAWAQANRTALVAVAAAAVVIAAVGAGVSWYRARQAAAAAVRFQSAHDEFQASRWEEAGEAFAGLGRDYPGTGYGRLAALYQGHALLRKPDPAAAAAAYGGFLAASPPTDYLRQEALMGLGAAREASADAPGARDAYEQAATIEGPFRSDARLSLARLYEAGGQPDRAKELYLAVLKESPSGFARTVLEAKIPADVATAGGETR